MEKGATLKRRRLIQGRCSPQLVFSMVFLSYFMRPPGRKYWLDVCIAFLQIPLNFELCLSGNLTYSAKYGSNLALFHVGAMVPFV